MNRKVMVVFAALMGVITMVTPVVALGPDNAENNPKLVNQVADKTGFEVTQIWLPSGSMNEWVNTLLPPFGLHA